MVRLRFFPKGKNGEAAPSANDGLETPPLWDARLHLLYLFRPTHKIGCRGKNSQAFRLVPKGSLIAPHSNRFVNCLIYLTIKDIFVRMR